MYHRKFVTSIKANGKVLRENDGEVAVPFGSEYSILLKNMNSVRAQVRVSIDGVEATDGWLILQPNGKLDLERWIKNGNLSKGNKFKFIERTANIEKHRGIEAEDGLVRVEYKFEKIYKAPQTVIHQYHYDYWHNHPWYNPPVIITTTPAPSWSSEWTFYNSNIQGGLVSSTTSSGSLGGAQSGQIFGAVNCAQTRSMGEFTKSAAPAQMNQSVMLAQCSMPENKAGITVPGSESNQTFYRASDFACESSEVIVLKLIGAIGETKVVKPITVDVKPKCVTCGRVNKATNKFCSDCGTSLSIIG